MGYVAKTDDVLVKVFFQWRSQVHRACTNWPPQEMYTQSTRQRFNYLACLTLEIIIDLNACHGKMIIEIYDSFWAEIRLSPGLLPTLLNV